MKAIIITQLCVLFCIASLQSQVPQQMNYQAVARNNAGNPLQNQVVSLRFSIHDGSAGGTVVYQETQIATTNALGLFSVQIGDGGVVAGSFAAVNWGNGNKFLQVELDPAGGTSYADMGTSQLLSVPYALYAANAPMGATGPTGATGPQGVTGPTGAANAAGSVNYLPKFTPSSTSLGNSQVYDNGSNIGIGTATPLAKLNVMVSTTDATAGIALTSTLTSGKTISINQGTAGKLKFTDPGVWDLVTMDFVNQRVGINNVNPSYPLEVNGSTSRVGNFVNTTSALSNSMGVFGSCYNVAGWGYGVYGEGGNTGVAAYADMDGQGDRDGVYAIADGGSGSDENIGVKAYASHGSYAYGLFGRGLYGSSTNYAAYFSGNVYATGSFVSSDRKLKDSIEQLTGALDIIQKLNPRTYVFRTNEFKQMCLPDGLQYGLIADEVEKVMPGAVKLAIQPAEYDMRNKEHKVKLSDEVRFQAVNYTEMIPILIAALKE